MSKVVGIILVIAVGLGGIYYWRNSHVQAAAEAGQEQATATVTRGTLVQSVASTGRVVSNLDVEIKCKASGRVEKLPFDVSDTVSQGDLLVELDPVDEERAVKLAEVALASSKARLDQARQNLAVAEHNLTTATTRAQATLQSAQARARELRTKADRRRDLLQQNLGSVEDYDTAESAAIVAQADVLTAQAAIEELEAQRLTLETRRQDITLAEAQVESDEIALANTRQRLADTKVFAPIDGVVSERNVQIGTIISSGITNVGGGTTVLLLSDLSRIFVLASVDESDIGRVQLDQDVQITVDAFPGVPFGGKVVRIATKGVNVSNVVTFEVKIEVTSENKSLLKPEMTANVQIVSDAREDVLLVPVKAISRRDHRSIAMVRRGGVTVEQEVQLGTTDGMQVEVVSGLAEGDVLVLQSSEPASRWRGGPMGPGGGPRR